MARVAGFGVIAAIPHVVVLIVVTVSTFRAKVAKWLIVGMAGQALRRCLEIAIGVTGGAHIADVSAPQRVRCNAMVEGSRAPVDNGVTFLAQVAESVVSLACAPSKLCGVTGKALGLDACPSER
jgi:hypothetical protein